MQCACGADFTPRKNWKSCSPTCSRVRTAKRLQEYNDAHPEKKRAAQRRYTAQLKRQLNSVNHSRKRSNRLDRAIRILFRLTGDQHERYRTIVRPNASALGKNGFPTCLTGDFQAR